MPELDTITIEGFKSIASIEDLKLGAINVVVGPNGSGKSNFIGVFEFLHAIREKHLQDYVVKSGGAEKILHFGSKVTPKLRIRISFQDGGNQYEITLAPTDADELVPQSECVFYSYRSHYPGPSNGVIPRVGKEAGISAPTQSELANYVRARLDRWRVYHFHDTGTSSPMKKTGDVNDNRFLRPDASNLAAFLFFLRHRHEVSYSLLRRTVQRVAPFFDDFQLEPQRLNPDKIRLEWRHKGLGRLFRRRLAVRRDAAVHRPGHALPATGGVPPIGDPGGRAGTRLTSPGHHLARVAGETGCGKDTGHRVHPVAPPARPFSARRHLGSRPRERRDAIDPARIGTTIALAGGLQPR